MNKLLIATLACVSILVTPSVFAQSNAPVTREQVRAELARLEAAGYSPSGEDAHYPDQLQAAEARVAAADTPDSSAYGAAAQGSFASGVRDAHADTRSPYSGQ
jgi:hypothetical protein